MRKKQFHKETIKVELISSGEQVDSKSWSSDLFNWDPISSGEGDLLLDDLATSFAASSEVSKKVKPIDFNSIIGSMPSHGFQFKSLISGTQATPQAPENSEYVGLIGKPTELPGSSDGNLERHNRIGLPLTGLTSVDKVPSKLQALENQHSPVVVPEPRLTSADKVPSELQALENQHSQILITCDATKALSDAVEIEIPTTITEPELNNSSHSTMNIDMIRMQVPDSQSRKSVNNSELHVSLPNEKGTLTADIVLDSASHVDSKEETSTPSKDSCLHAPSEEENLRSSSITPEAIGHDLMEEDSSDLDMKNEDTSLPFINLSPDEQFSDKGHFEEPEHDPPAVTGHAPPLESDAVRVEHNPVVNSGPPDVTTEDQQHGKADAESNHEILLQSTSGKYTVCLDMLRFT